MSLMDKARLVYLLNRREKLKTSLAATEQEIARLQR